MVSENNFFFFFRNGKRRGERNPRFQTRSNKPKKRLKNEINLSQQREREKKKGKKALGKKTNKVLDGGKRYIRVITLWGAIEWILSGSLRLGFPSSFSQHIPERPDPDSGTLLCLHLGLKLKYRLPTRYRIPMRDSFEIPSNGTCEYWKLFFFPFLKIFSFSPVC